MPAIQGSVSVPANSTNDNVIAGSQFEYLPYDAEIEVGVVGSAAGLLVDVFSGPDVLAEAFACSTQNRFPVYPDDFAFADYAVAGDRLKIRARNTTAGALTLFYRVNMSQAG